MHKSILSVVISLLVISNPVYSQGVDLFVSQQELSLMSAQTRQLYGPTGPDAHWRASQWGTSCADLPSFVSRRTKNKCASVGAARPDIVRLWNTGKTLECGKEFDLLIGSNRDARLSETDFSLAELNQLEIQARVKVRWIRHDFSNCTINQTTVLLGLTLTNDVASPQQIIFYQLTLAYECGNPRAKWCDRTPRTSPSFFNPGQEMAGGVLHRFGIKDSLAWMGRALLLQPSRRFSEIVVDVLPRLKQGIAANVILDQDLSHWKIGGTYHGNAILGREEVASEWKGMRVVAYPQ